MDQPEALAPLSCAEVVDLEAAYAWGALDAKARARVDRHRRGCAGCDARLLAADRTVDTVNRAVPRVEPPPELRQRVLAAIDRLEQPAASRPAALAGARPDHAHGPPPGGRARPSWRSIGRPDRFWSGLATGAVGTLVAAALAWVLLVRPDALTELSPARSLLAPGERARQAPSLPLPGSGPASSSRLLELRPSAGPGHGLLAYDAETGRGVLLIEGMPPSPPEYGVWLSQGSQRVHLGDLSVDPRGVGVFVLPEPLPLQRPERIEVAPTSAPAGGGGGVLAATF